MHFSDSCWLSVLSLTLLNFLLLSLLLGFQQHCDVALHSRHVVPDVKHIAATVPQVNDTVQSNTCTN
jgi:hypothetical protein